MAVSRRGLALLPCSPALLAVLAVSVAPARADDAATSCRLLNLDFTVGGIPAGARGTPAVASPEITPQIVAWIEKPTGEYLHTIYITQETGRFGLGNRPGRFDFNSGPGWPYGRRVNVFPVWSNRNGLSVPQLEYRNAMDSDLSHPFDNSSPEHHFCRPLETSDIAWDAGSCSSTIYTDKGVFGAAKTGYPPRVDVTPTASIDSDSVAMYKALNPFDAISQATPRLGTFAHISSPIPADLVPGDYVMFLEVSLEQDFNNTYNSTAFPSPVGISYGTYGVAYRGQPSVIYRVPFTISTVETIATTDSYAGYGDPNGASGTLHPPDGTITSNVPNSGASRLLLTSDNGKLFRVRVDAKPEEDRTPPGAIGSMIAGDANGTGVTLTFTAPGDDGATGTVAGYDVRYQVGTAPITAANFDQATEAKFDGTVAAPGAPQVITISNLLPETQYTFAVRAFDDCHNTSPIATTAFVTPEPVPGQVSACFVATAAYGSVLANDVEMLRRFRDMMLKRSVLGELAVEAYYTFGPSVAGVVGESDLLRATARGALTPVVERVRGLHW